MNNTEGRKRVFITNVSPRVGNGTYPGKTTLEDDTLISADIYCDGHDDIGASIFIKHKKERQWKEFPMRLKWNDHWEYVFNPQKLGFYQFQVLGWVDHFGTWKNGLIKKFEAGQDVHVELLIGASLLDKAAENAKGREKSALIQWSNELKGGKNQEASVMLIQNEKLALLMHHCKDQETITIFPQTLEIEVERKKAIYSTWYELFPRSASPYPDKHGTFKDVERLLPRISEMGFDTLYFPPIHPIGEKNRKGKNNTLVATEEDPGSPWAVGSRYGGHKDIHPELGTLKDFHTLIGEAKKHNIEIAMDIAFQCAPDHPYVTEYPQWFKWRPDGTVQYAENPPKKYEDILPFNFETSDWKNLWTELKSIFEYWIDNGVHIFRVDNPHTKSLAFWEWVIPQIRKENPNTIFLAEAFTRPRLMEQLAKGGFNQSYTYFTWRNTKAELQEYLTELTKTDMRHYYRPNFWPNTPDILPPMLTQGGENAHVMRFILAATMSSNYGIYGPVYEFCYTMPAPGKEEYIDSEKYEIKHWDWDKYTRMKEIIVLINKIRRENAALQTTWNIEFTETSNDQVICYTKTDHKHNNFLIVAVNLDPFNPQSAYIKVPIEHLGIQFGQQFVVHDLIGGDKYKWQDEWNYVQLNPYEMPAHILKVEL